MRGSSGSSTGSASTSPPARASACGDAGHLVAQRVEQLGDPLAQLRLGLGAVEGRHRLAAGHDDDVRDRLHLEGLRDARVRVDVDLRENPRAAALGGELLEHRRELLAGPAPLGPEVDDDRHLHRALDDLGLERLLGDVQDDGRRGAATGGGRATAARGVGGTCCGAPPAGGRCSARALRPDRSTAPAIADESAAAWAAWRESGRATTSSLPGAASPRGQPCRRSSTRAIFACICPVWPGRMSALSTSETRDP